MVFMLLLLSFVILSPLLLKLVSHCASTLRTNKQPAPRLPPGPWQLPVVGSLHHLLLSRSRHLPHQAMAELLSKYGQLMMLRLGAAPTLVVSSAQAAREVMRTHDTQFCGRYPTATTNITSRGGQGIVFSPYNYRWRESRKICVMELFCQRRVLGFRPVREEEVARLVRSVSGECGLLLPVNLTDKIARMVSDTIVRAAIGGRCEQQDKLLYYINKSFGLSEGFNLADLYPSSRLMCRLSATTRHLVGYASNIRSIIEGIIRDRAQLLAVERDDDDLVSVLLRLQKNGGLQFPLTIEHISTIILDIFAAGSETASTTLDWTMAELMKNPRVLHKAQSEVRKTFAGKDKLDEEDITKLSYQPLVLKETLRMHAPIPLLIPRECREACQVMGYDIPKGCRVLVNVWAIGRDNAYWEDPKVFNSERFENCNVDFKGTNFEFLPFGQVEEYAPA